MIDTLSSNPYEPVFTAQKTLFRTGATRAREWRLDQLARMERMLRENEAELQDAVKSDFKTASQEYVFETQAAIGEVALQRSHLDDWMNSEIIITAPKLDLDYALQDVPNGVCAIAHEIVHTHGTAMAEEFLERTLSAIAASALAVLGRERACCLLERQLFTTETLWHGD
jgi:hypothetical protein